MPLPRVIFHMNRTRENTFDGVQFGLSLTWRGHTLLITTQWIFINNIPQLGRRIRVHFYYAFQEIQ